MIRDLAKKVDWGFKVGRVHEGGSLEDALFRGGSDDGFWDARSQGGLFFKIRESLELKVGRSSQC